MVVKLYKDEWNFWICGKRKNKNERKTQALFREEKRKNENERKTPALFREAILSIIEWALAAQEKEPNITDQDHAFVKCLKKQKREKMSKLLQIPKDRMFMKKQKEELERNLQQNFQVEDPDELNWFNNNDPENLQGSQQQWEGRTTLQVHQGRKYPQQQQRESDPVRPGLNNNGSGFIWVEKYGEQKQQQQHQQQQQKQKGSVPARSVLIKAYDDVYSYGQPYIVYDYYLDNLQGDQQQREGKHNQQNQQRKNDLQQHQDKQQQKGSVPVRSALNKAFVEDPDELNWFNNNNPENLQGSQQQWEGRPTLQEQQGRKYPQQQQRESDPVRPGLNNNGSGFIWVEKYGEQKQQQQHQQQQQKQKGSVPARSVLIKAYADDPEELNWANNNEPKNQQEGQQQWKDKQTHQKQQEGNYPQQQRHKQHQQRGSDPVRPGFIWADGPKELNWANNNEPKNQQEGQQQWKDKQTHQKQQEGNYPQQQRHKQHQQRGSDPVRPGFIWGSLVWLFFLLPLVSAQCSTCLGGRCYDTGQCILGCVPGYMDIYCDKACPSNCLNKACLVNTTSATISCTDGCWDGFCGTKCTRRCPEGCTTCDRQCGSCNMTLCPERRYGKGCKGVCNPTYEKCDRETGQCIKCRYGKIGDNCDRKCPRCYPRGQNLKYKCMSGCEMCKAQDPCPDGLFGDNCDLKCAENCDKSEETGGQPCNRATGECSTGCVSGYHGLTCNYTCSRFCVGGICNQHDGVCTSGCISGYTQKLESCEKLEDKAYIEVGDVPVSHVNILLVISLVCSLLAVPVLCGLMVARSFSRRSRESSEKIENADKNEREGLTGGEL